MQTTFIPVVYFDEIKCDHLKVSSIHLFSSSKTKHNTGEPTLVKGTRLQNLMKDARCKVFKSSHKIDMVLN